MTERRQTHRQTDNDTNWNRPQMETDAFEIVCLLNSEALLLDGNWHLNLTYIHWILEYCWLRVYQVLNWKIDFDWQNYN